MHVVAKFDECWLSCYPGPIIHRHNNGNKIVLKKSLAPSNMSVQWEGPSLIQRVHVNFTVTIDLRNGVTEKINICRLKPYWVSTNVVAGLV